MLTYCVGINPAHEPICGKPLPPERWEHGPWLCDECQAKASVYAATILPSRVPMVADVHQLMAREGISQDEAARRLGGQP